MQYVHKTIPTKSRRMCSVFQCSTYCTKDISLHSFPADPKLCKAWQSALKIGKPVTKYMLVCSLHFTQNDFTLTTSKLRRLKKFATPSRKIPKLSNLTKKPAVDRSERHLLQKCSSNTLEEDTETEDDENIVSVSQDNTREELAKPGTNKSHLIAENGPSLTNVLSEDKITQTGTFQLPTLLNSDKKLMHFIDDEKNDLVIHYANNDMDDCEPDNIIEAPSEKRVRNEVIQLDDAKRKLKNYFMKCANMVNNMSLEDVNAVTKIVAAIEPTLDAIKNQDNGEGFFPQSVSAHNENIQPQRRCYSNKKKQNHLI